MHFVCRGLLPWKRTANIECTLQAGAQNAGRADTARDPERASERASLRKHRPPGCFRKLRATVRVHLDTVKLGRKLGRGALIFLEISLLNERCSTRPAGRRLTRALPSPAMIPIALKRCARGIVTSNSAATR